MACSERRKRVRRAFLAHIMRSSRRASLASTCTRIATRRIVEFARRVASAHQNCVRLQRPLVAIVLRRVRPSRGFAAEPRQRRRRLAVAVSAGKAKALSAVGSLLFQTRNLHPVFWTHNSTNCTTLPFCCTVYRWALPCACLARICCAPSCSPFAVSRRHSTLSFSVSRSCLLIAHLAAQNIEDPASAAIGDCSATSTTASSVVVIAPCCNPIRLVEISEPVSAPLTRLLAELRFCQDIDSPTATAVSLRFHKPSKYSQK